MQEFPLLYLLAGHVQAEELEDPAGELSQVGHDLQELPSLYWLAGHLQSERRVIPYARVSSSSLALDLYSSKNIVTKPAGHFLQKLPLLYSKAHVL
jgi:hypothetical protein